MLFIISIIIFIVIVLSIIFIKKDIDDIPIFIISLERAKERRMNMKNKMKEINKKYTFFNAVDGKNMTKYEESLCNKFEGLNDGQKGCFLSHYLLWKNLLLTDRDDFIILEDDAVILDDMEKFLLSDYDFIHLGFCYENYNKKIITVDEYSIYKTNYALCTHGYIVSKSGIKKLLDFLDNEPKWDYPIDHVMNKIVDFNKYIIIPELVKQSGEKSYIN